MIEQRGGRIINIASVAGLRGYALRSPYCASKWGMLGLTETTALEVGRYNITANSIAPGPVSGPRIEAVIQKRATEMGRTYEEVEHEYLSQVALGRMVEESDIAAMAIFLASDEGRNISGENITVAGGFGL
jgi:NAD(P)-dependent dehydrogenase (short-subunit alcohol dehydrogenase family)